VDEARTGRGSRTRTRLLAVWAAASVALQILHLVRPVDSVAADSWWPWVIGLAAFPVAAAVVLAHRPGNGVGRALAVVAVAANGIFLSASIVDAGRHLDATRWVEPLSNGAAVTQFAGIVALLWVFPTGRPSPRFVLPARVLGALAVGLAVLFTLAPTPLPITGRVNPFGVDTALVRAVERDGFAIVPLAAVVGVVSLVQRRSAADAVTRAQLRWFLAGSGALLTMFVIVIFSSASSDPLVEAGAGVLIVLGFWSLPAAIAAAIVRYHLFDIDRLVSRTVSYAVVIGLLVTMYSAVVVTLQTRSPLAGSDLAVAASTLLTAALFTPLRRRVQAVVDRRFNRARVESAAAVERFARQLRDEVDLEAVRQHLIRTASTTLHPSVVAVWMPDAPPAES
jgi:hypothetical protein